jgi:tetratricopeptide (TPR) repeat protein
LIYANICYDAGAFDSAIAWYDKALEDLEADPSYQNLIWTNLAYCHEAKQEFGTAISYHEKVASGPSDVLKSVAFFNIGRLYAASGKLQESKNAFERLISNYPDSMYSELAKEKVARLPQLPEKDAS